MNDQWVPSPPAPDPPWTNPIPPSNDWNETPPCAAQKGPSIVDGIIVTGVPATIIAPNAWGITLNDGDSPPNFTIDHYDGTGTYIDSPMEMSGVDGSIQFSHPILLSRDPVEPMEAVTLEYLEAHGAGVPEVPDNQTYGRTEGAWNLVVPAAGGTFTGQTNLGAGGAVTSGALLFAGNAICSVPTIAQLQLGGGSLGQVPATDGSGNLSWVTPVTGGPYLPLSGGTVTGNLTVTGIMTVNGPNSMVLNAAPGNQRAILGQSSGLTRWQLQLGDQTAEGAGNQGSNFSLSAYGLTGTFLGNWLTIARADGSTVFNGSGVTIAGGLAVNGLLAVNSVGNFYLPGGSAGQVLTTNGSGILSWASQSGGIPDAPNDGTQYGRQNSAWTPIVSGGASITVSDTPPSSPAVGALWWNSAAAAGGGQLYVWYADPNTSQWVPATNTQGQPGAQGPQGPAGPGASGENRLINGDMRINQRGVTGATIPLSKNYTVDRWQTYTTTATGSAAWAQVALPASNPLGLGWYFSWQCNTAFTPASTDTFLLRQAIEADYIADFGFGGANAQPITLSFWVQGVSLSGTMSGSVQNFSGNRSYPFTFPITSTWTNVSVTIPGNTTGTWVQSGSGGGLILAFDMGTGAAFRNTAGAWYTTGYYGAIGALMPISIAGCQFNITGVKLEVGSVATPFNRVQSLAKALIDCQRYYQKIGGGSGADLAVGGYVSGGASVFSTFGIAAMRAAPTATIVGAFTQTNITTVTLYPALQTVGIQLATSTAGGFAWYNPGPAQYVTLSAEL